MKLSFRTILRQDFEFFNKDENNISTFYLFKADACTPSLNFPATTADLVPTVS
jgi:hypothetical protein